MKVDAEHATDLEAVRRLIDAALAADAPPVDHATLQTIGRLIIKVIADEVMEAEVGRYLQTLLPAEAERFFDTWDPQSPLQGGARAALKQEIMKRVRTMYLRGLDG